MGGVDGTSREPTEGQTWRPTAPNLLSTSTETQQLTQKNNSLYLNLPSVISKQLLHSKQCEELSHSIIADGI